MELLLKKRTYQHFSSKFHAENTFTVLRAVLLPRAQIKVLDWFLTTFRLSLDNLRADQMFYTNQINPLKKRPKTVINFPLCEKVSK